LEYYARGIDGREEEKELGNLRKAEELTPLPVRTDKRKRRTLGEGGREPKRGTAAGPGRNRLKNTCTKTKKKNPKERDLFCWGSSKALGRRSWQRGKS